MAYVKVDKPSQVNRIIYGEFQNTNLGSKVRYDTGIRCVH